MELFLLIIRLILASVFALAGVAKLIDLPGAERAAVGFGIPERLAKMYATALSAAEIAIAILLIFTATSFFGAVFAALLLIVFIAGMAYQLIKGRSPDCHCFGQLYSKPVTKSSVIRNVLLLVLPVSLMAAGPTRQGIDLWQLRSETVPTILGVATILMIAGIIGSLKRIADQQNKILRRIEFLELISSEGQSVNRDEARDPYDGLPIGAKFPAFALPDATGRKVGLADLATDERSLLFIFVGPNCTPCAALVPEIAEWRTRLADKVKVVLLSGGSAKENKQKFGSDGIVLIEEDSREIANKVGARWTPTALLISGNGRVTSHLAVGDAAIRELVVMIESADVNDPFFYYAPDPERGRSPKIGNRIPEFSIDDVNGRLVSSDQFVGHPTLVTFWSPGCPHCREMLASLREWDANRTSADPNLVVFSEGDVEEHRRFGLNSPVVIGYGQDVSIGFGMWGTPSAVLVDGNGNIISETAMGAKNIWALVGRYNGNGSGPHNHNLNGKTD